MCYCPSDIQSLGSISDMQLEQPVSRHRIVGTVLIVSSRPSHFIQEISLYNQCESLFYFFQLFTTVWKHLAAVAEAVFHISLHISLFFFFLSPSPLSWLCSWMIESAILYASCLSLVLCGGEREREGARSCRGYWERITASHDGEEWEKKTRLPCSINCCLRETDILGGQQFWKCDQLF